MAQLTRDLFKGGVEDLWELVKSQFAKDGVVHSRLVGLDARSRQTYFMSVARDGSQSDAVLARGWVPVPGPWIDNVDLIKAVFSERKLVAAILVAEAWVASNDTAFEAARMNIAPHEHPMKSEIVFALGSWPREYLTTGYVADIERDDHGNGTLINEASMTDDSLIFGAWLDEVLPKPHGRP